MSKWQIDLIANKSKSFSHKLFSTDVSDIVRKYNMTQSLSYDEKELETFLEYFDPLAFLREIKDFDNELVTFQLENNVLANFLEKNEPRSLVGITSRYQRNPSLFKIDAETVVRKSVELKTVRSSTLSSVGKDKVKEFVLNVKTKARISESVINDLEKRIVEIENNTDKSLRNLRSYGEELKIRTAESELAQKNFSMHFIDKPEDCFFLEKAQPMEIFRKWYKYFQNYMEKSSGLLHLMTLKMSSLLTKCRSMESNISSRTEMSTYTTEIDYDNLVIVRNGMLNKLNGLLKTIKSLELSRQKASHTCLDALKLLKKKEFAFKDLKHKCDELNRHINRVDKEINQIKTRNAKDVEILISIEDRNNRFIAPNIEDYIEKKDELATAIKEEKILNRKTNILNMKLTNLKLKLRKLNQPISKNGKKLKQMQILK